MNAVAVDKNIRDRTPQAGEKVVVDHILKMASKLSIVTEGFEIEGQPSSSSITAATVE